MRGIHRHSSDTRDAALLRLTRVNRWLIAGSVTLTGVLAEVAAQAFPGKKLATASAAATNHKAASRERHPPEAPEALHPPEQAPQSSSEAPAEAQAQQAERSEGGAPESTPQSPESAPSAESAPPAETAAPESAPREEAPPVVSGAS
jgi:hypothetical protein